MRMEELTMEEFNAGLEKTRTVIIPFGSLEEHGPHLPLGTDTLIAARAAAAASELRTLFVAPALPYGLCRSTSGHPGTVTLAGDTLRRLAKDLVRGLHRQGLRNFVLLSGHAGGTHVSALVEAGEELLEELDGIRVAVCSLLDLAGPRWARLQEEAEDSHAGEVETSFVLLFKPHLVKGSAKRETPSFPGHILVKNKRRYWPGGVWGDPGLASKDKGKAFLRAASEAVAGLVDGLESLEE